MAAAPPGITVARKARFWAKNRAFRATVASEGQSFGRQRCRRQRRRGGCAQLRRGAFALPGSRALLARTSQRAGRVESPLSFGDEARQRAAKGAPLCYHRPLWRRRRNMDG